MVTDGSRIVWYAPHSSHTVRLLYIRKGSEVPKSVYFNSGDGERGPGWYDVFAALQRLRTAHGSDVQLRITTSSSVRNQWGLYAVVRRDGCPTIFGCCGYGNAYPNGARTLSAACYVALAKAESHLDELRTVPESGGAVGSGQKLA